MKSILKILLIFTILLTGCQAPDIQVNNIKEYQLKAGDEIALDGTGLSLYVESISNMQEVKPNNPSGYYEYFKENEGYHYFVINGKIKNPNQIEMKASHIAVKAYSNNKELEGKFVIESVSESNFINEISIAEETGYRIIVIVKDNKKDPDKIELYYEDNLEKNNEENVWKNCIKFNL